MSDECIFCRIVGGELPAHVVYEDDDTIAFLDKSPLFKGHTLVVPKAHVVTLMDIAEDQVEPVFRATRRVSIAVRSAMESDGIFNAVNNLISQSVAHLHVHVVPRNKKDGLRGFMWPRHKYQDDSEASGVALRIRQCAADA